MGSLSVKKLADIVEFLDTRRKPVKSSERKPGPYPYYGANGQQGTIDGFLFDEPLLLLAEDGGHFFEPGRGIAYRISGKTWVNNHAHVLRARSGIELGYLHHQLRNMNVQEFLSGTTRAKLTKEGASRIRIKVPPLPEQRRIAAILDKAEDIKRKRQEAIRLAKELVPALFQKFLTQVSRSKGSPLLLADVADVKSGIAKGKKYPKGERLIEAAYLRVANVQDGYLDLSVIKEMKVSYKDQSSTALERGDVLVTEGGDPDKLGRGYVWDGEIENCIHQNHIFRIRPKVQELDSYFLSDLLGSAYGKSYFLGASKQTTGIASINMTQLKAFPVIVPRVAEARSYQKERVAILRKIERLIASEQEVGALGAALAGRYF